MAKQTQIVCQHLENISRKALEEYQDIIREYIRRRHGVYALYRKGKLHYVGLASNLRSRLKQHLHDRHKDSWDRFSVYLTIDNKAIKELETLLLRIVNPDGNVQTGRFVKSQNLAVQFKKDVRQKHREKVDDLIGGRRKKTLKKKAGKEKGPKGATPPLAKYVGRGPMKLRARYKGKLHRAVVRRDGWIRYDGMIYKTPSAAGMAIRKRQTNGWQFWQCERSPGDWIPLSKLRE